MSVLDTETIDYENIKLSDLFDKGWKLQQDLNKNGDESSEAYLKNRIKALEILDKCEYMLDELHLFSDNESLDEVSSNELRYFLINALIGWLRSKINSTKSEVRLIDLAKAREQFIKFLVLTKNYELHKFNMEKFKLDSNKVEQSEFLDANGKSKQEMFDANLVNQAYDRNEKIRRYKEQKELETQMQSMTVSTSSGVKIDDEVKRKYYLTCLKYWINKAVDDMKLIDDEINILKSIEQEKIDKQNRGDSKKASGYRSSAAEAGAAGASKPAPKAPFIITKDALQAQVFGAGYPSLPVYSIEQFYDKLSCEGHVPKPGEPEAPVKIGGGVTESQKEKEKAERDLKEDANDEDELRKQREWDEFKDENKRGHGNRFNRS